MLYIGLPVGFYCPMSNKAKTLKELFNIFDTALLNVVGNIDSFRSIMQAINEHLDQFEFLGAYISF
jgi:hypothetical protein